MKTSRRIIYVTFLMILLASLLSACAGGASAAAGWPGITLSDDGQVAYLAFQQHVHAVDTSNGSELWRFPQEADRNISFFAPPALTEDGNLVVGGYNNILYNLRTDAAAGQNRVNWTFTGAANRYVDGPLVTEQGIFAPNADKRLYALDESGNLLWTFESTQSLWGRPVANGGLLYVPAMDHRIYALDMTSGELVWDSGDLGGAIVGSPLLSEDGVLYAGTFNNQMLALDAASGEVLWQVTTRGWIWASPVLDGDILYFGDLQGNFYALPTSGGDFLWQVSLENGQNAAIPGQALVLEDTVYFTAENGTFHALDKANGQARWVKTLTGTNLYTGPVWTGEYILVAPVGGNARLVAFGPNGEQAWTFEP